MNSYRALLKEADGDITKWVQNTKKPRDTAQRWRAFKNIARFFKNPIGYIFWKVAQLHNFNRFRVVYAILIYHLYQSFQVYLLSKQKKENMISKWRWHIGEINKHYDSPHTDRRLPADRKKNYVRYSNFHQQLRNKRVSMIHLNWWCRDQNFRKYFEMRKRHDIKPALSGFYHDDIYENTLRTNTEWANMRASQQPR